MDAGTTTTDNWLLLTDFASKHRISVSTLRRRIKSEQIKFKLDHGRYFIFDEAPAYQGAPESVLKELSGREHEEPILSSATRILNELKRAYTNVLQEKEEQIIQLKEEVTDLKTLVRVLESDNDRMRRLLMSRNQE